ncbi:MAG: thiamine diphosphokinase [Bdellovibrionales bacterium]|nr:thiamine diphosphokinase [Bdellovibrionales bacterium]
MTALLFLDGNIPCFKNMEEICKSAEVIVAADGAANRLHELEIFPDLIVGDFDSIHEDCRNAFSQAEYIHRPEQDATDFEKCMRMISSRGIEQVRIVGAVGKRKDYSLSHFFMAMQFLKDMRIEFLFEDSSAYLLTTKTWAFECPINTTMSLIPMMTCKVSLQGFQYLLDQEVLEPGYVGMSNVVTHSESRVDILEGVALVFFLHDRVMVKEM